MTDELAAEGLVASPASQVEELAIAQVKAHWFTQGGEAQFGAIDGNNADEVVAEILDVVRNSISEGKKWLMT